MCDPSQAGCGDLLRRTFSSGKKAYGELVARYQRHVYGLAYSLVGDWASAQDAAQETFIRSPASVVPRQPLIEPAPFF